MYCKRFIKLEKDFTLLRINNDICISRAQKEANCRTTRIQCDVYAAQNPEVLMVSEGNLFFFSSQPLLKCRVMCLLIQESGWLKSRFLVSC